MASPDTERPSARRYLIATAVTRVSGAPELDVPELDDDVKRMEELFLGELGYLSVELPRINPSRRQFLHRLREFARSQDRRPDDYLVLYLAAHGEVSVGSGEFFLLLADTDPADLPGTGLPIGEMVRALWDETPLQRVLLLLDSCYAGVGVAEGLARAMVLRRFKGPVQEAGSTGLVFISSSRRREETSPGALTAAFTRAVRNSATAGNAAPSVSLNNVMAALRSDPAFPDHQRPTWSLAEASSSIPEFLPNPHFLPGLAGRQLDEIDVLVGLRRRQSNERRSERLTHFLPRARGTDTPADEMWSFTGRHRALCDLVDWLRPARASERLCLVTGDPGSGKSALLGLADVLSDPEYRGSVPLRELGLPPDALPPKGSIDIAIHASHKSTREVLDGVAAGADIGARTVGELLARLQLRKQPLVVLIDAVDEAVDPDELVAELLRPLADSSRDVPLRLLLGSRRHTAERLHIPAFKIDLDKDKYADPAAVREYVRKLLRAPDSALAAALAGTGAVTGSSSCPGSGSCPQHPATQLDDIAEAIAEAAGRSFLVARITARTVAREAVPPDPFDQVWRDGLPRLPGQAMERDLAHLGDQAQRARDLLLPLAFAQGAGIPRPGFWAPLATAVTGRRYTDEDIVWLRRHAGSYVVEGIEDGNAVYRIYHRALIEYLREPHDARQVQAKVTATLRAAVVDWTTAHPYVRRHLALHAAEAGALDSLVDDAAFVLTSEPEQLLAALPSVRTEPGRRAGRALRQISDRLRERDQWTADPQSRTRLRFAAVCQRADALAASCDLGDEPLDWRARWAVWNPRTGARQFQDPFFRWDQGAVVPTGDGAVLVESYWYGEPQGWNLNDGGRINVPQTAPLQLVGTQAWTTVRQNSPVGAAAAVALRDWRSMVSFDYVTPRTIPAFIRVLTVWDFADRTARTWKLPVEMVGPRDPASLVQTAVLTEDSGLPIAAFLRTLNGRLEVFDLTTEPAAPVERRRLREQGEPRYGSLAYLRAVERTMCRAVSVPVPTPFLEDGLSRVSCLVAAEASDGVLIGCQDGALWYWGRGERDGNRLDTGHNGAVVDAREVAPHPSGTRVVTAGADGTVRVCGLEPGGHSQLLFTASRPLQAVAVRRWGRQWLVAAVAEDGLLHRCDLDSGRLLDRPVRIGGGGPAKLTTCDMGNVPTVVVQGSGRSLQMYDLMSGESLGGTADTAEVTALVRTADGSAVCSGDSQGIVRVERGHRAVDTTVIDAHDGAVLALGEVAGPLPDGRVALVSVGTDHLIRCWEPSDGREYWLDGIQREGPWAVPLATCAAVGSTGPGTAVVVAGDAAGRIWSLHLEHGVPVRRECLSVGTLVTALCLGTVRGRQVGVAVTSGLEVCCWDLLTCRWISRSLPAAGERWIGSLALDPTGSGLLAAGDEVGFIHRWNLPSGRPQGKPFPAHRRGVTALAFINDGASGQPLLVSTAISQEVTAWKLGAESHSAVATGRTTSLVSALVAGDRGEVLCGDVSGAVVRCVPTPGRSWRAAPVLEDRNRARAVTVAERQGARVVAIGRGAGLEYRAIDSGNLVSGCESTGRLPLWEAESFRCTGGSLQDRIASLNELNMLEIWDAGVPDDESVSGRTLLPTRPYSARDNTMKIHVLRRGDYDSVVLSSTRDGRPGLHDIARGSVGDGLFPGFPPTALKPDRVWVVACGDRRLLLAQDGSRGLAVADLDAERWALGFRISVADPVAVLPLPDADIPSLLVVSARGAQTYSAASVLAALDATARFHRKEREQLPGWRSLHLRPVSMDPQPRPVRRRMRGLAPILDQDWSDVLVPRLARLVPGGRACVVTSWTAVAVFPLVSSGEPRVIDIGARCEDLAVGPDGEIVLATSAGVVLIDPVDLP